MGCRENKSTKFQSTKTIPINLFLGCRENKSKRAEENKLGKKSMYPQMFLVLGKRTKRSLTGTKHARSENFFPTLGKKKKKKKFRSVLVPGGFW